MASNICRCLVVDACVARAAGGEDAKHPVSQNCRNFLHEMLDLSHKIVRTQPIWIEWKKHKSIYAAVWLNKMIAKKRIHFVEPVEDEKLRNFPNSNFNEKEAAAMLKDCHLVEAANAADHVVVSKEIVARKLFTRASESVGWLRTVAWVNPTEATETPIDWLRNGAEPAENRCIHRLPV